MEAKVSLWHEVPKKPKTGICSGKEECLPEEQAESTRYFYEYASGRFGLQAELLEHVQAFHFKVMGPSGEEPEPEVICHAGKIDRP